MQEEGHNIEEFSNHLNQFVLFEGILKDEESKIQLVGQELHLNSSDEKIKGKKQGRGRSEKNAQNKIKRSKNDTCVDKKQKGHWSMEQNKRYHWFLEIYHQHFIHKEMRRLDKIFKTMATFVGSRQAEQCRSHHQKMEKKYRSFSKILLHLRQEHYGGEDRDLLVKDIEASSTEHSVAVLSYQQLRKLEWQRKEKEQIQEEKKHQENEQNQDKQANAQEGLGMDFFGENYEINFDMNSIII